MKKSKVERFCKVCDKKFYVIPFTIKKGNGKFCSQKCYGKWISQNRKTKNNPSWKGGKIKRTCEICDKEFYIYPYRINTAKFCSLKCRNKWDSKNKIGKNHPNWRGGISFEPYGLKFNDKLKEQTRKRDNYICQECGFHQGLLKEKLSIHHIDYNKKNNNPENLISLCNSCHMQTNFSRNDWRKYFQNKRTLTIRGVNMGQ